MKKFILIMMAFMASFSVYAQEESSASVTYTANLDYYTINLALLQEFTYIFTL